MIIGELLSTFSWLRPKYVFNSVKNLSKTRQLRSKIRLSLRKNNFSKIKPNETHTWKIYKNGDFRITLSAKKEKLKFLIKIDSDKERASVSFNFYKLFNNCFSFIPHGECLSFDNHYYLITEYINHKRFPEMKPYIKRHYNDYLVQAIEMLKSLAKYRIIHCDLGQYNLIFEKENKKMILIDFDTWHSDLYLNECCKKPPRKQTYQEFGKNIFDDAYCFKKMFDSLNIKNISSNPNYKILEKMIGQNIFKR